MKRTTLDYRDGAVDLGVFSSATKRAPAGVPVSCCFRMRGVSAITRWNARGDWRGLVLSCSWPTSMAAPHGARYPAGARADGRVAFGCGAMARAGRSCASCVGSTEQRRYGKDRRHRLLFRRHDRARARTERRGTKCHRQLSRRPRQPAARRRAQHQGQSSGLSRRGRHAGADDATHGFLKRRGPPVDWQVQIYGGAGHAFTNPGADPASVPELRVSSSGRQALVEGHASLVRRSFWCDR